MNDIRGRTISGGTLIAGLNVALATVASLIAAAVGQPNVALPICGMVGAVYGVSSVIRSIQR